MLNFDCHIKNICKKAVQQLNILKRIGKNLSTKRRALSCIFSIFFVLVSEQKCQDKGQKLKFDSTKV
jgi:hypothetical protein